MENLNLKDSVEKDTFFRKLANLAEQLPREIVLKKVSFSTFVCYSLISPSECHIGFFPSSCYRCSCPIWNLVQLWQLL